VQVEPALPICITWLLRLGKEGLMLRVHVLLATALVMLVPAMALAAAPVKGGLYTGKISNRGTAKRLDIHVSKTGKTATAAVFCSNTKTGSLRLKIVRGKFAARKTVGTVLVWAVAGRFVSSTKARVSVKLHTLCDGLGGLAILTLSHG
jgi:hypothetical protein